MGEVVFSFAFHGGAGVIPKGSVDSCIYEPSLEAIACKTFAYAETNLSNDNVGAIDVAQFAVQLLENDPLYNAGKGAVLATNGEHELEASIMDGATLQSGAVSMIKNYPSPISLARLVMDKTPHVYMVGEGAEALAAEHGFERVPDNAYFCTEKRLDQLRQAKGAGRVYCDHDLPNKAPSVLDAGTGTENGTAGEATNINSEPSSLPPSPCYSSTNSISSNTVLGDTDTGTVGCVCYYKGSVAAATSTGGMTNKLNGRIGDTPIIGAGTYANNHTCAVSATGEKVLIILC